MEKLGTQELSPDVLKQFKVGLWAVEMDEGVPPRMYGDSIMMELLGLTEEVSPEETFKHWIDNVAREHYNEVMEMINRIISGIHGEVQYPWHYPDGEVITVRCGGIRNYSYTKGIRLEGMHQNVSSMVHYQKSRLEDVLAALADDYMYIYFLNPYTGVFEEFVVENGSRGYNTEIRPQDVDFYDDVEAKSSGIVHPDDMPVIKRVYDRDNLINILENGESEEFVVRWPQPDSDQCIYMKNKISCHCDAVGNRKLVIGVKDVTQEQVREELLRKATQDAEAASISKSTFLFNMSHDIRTPMNAILGYADRLERHYDDAELVQDSIGKIKSSGDYLLGLINEILDMARIESNKVILEEDVYDIRSRAHLLCDVLEVDMQKKNLTFNIDFEEVRDPVIWYDSLRLRQIMMNIISNAIKYTPDGGTILHTMRQLDCDREGYGRYEIVVKDNGIGMTKEFLGHIFEQFVRSEEATTRKTPGTGLGMSIVGRLVDLMGGTIDIESEPGQGTTVTILLDLKIATEEEKQHVAAVQSRQRPEVKLQGKKILLVEDNELNLEIARELLEEKGCIIEVADNGVNAVGKVKTSKPGDIDLILMDIQMPVMNGYEATKCIRALEDKRLAEIPIVAMTANAFEEDRAKSRECGMNAHLAKPVNVQELEEAIKNFAL